MGVVKYMGVFVVELEEIRRGEETWSVLAYTMDRSSRCADWVPFMVCWS